MKEIYKLIYSDTDSLVYSLQHNDIYEWIKNNKNHFDLSDSLRPDLKDDKNKKVLGKFKDEFNSLLIKDFLALNPKVYSINYQTLNEQNQIIDKNKKTCKGVKSVVLKNEITHQDYQNVLETNEPAKRDIVSIRSFDHQLYTHKTHGKVALSSFYDKMKMIDSINCVPFGYDPSQ